MDDFEIHKYLQMEAVEEANAAFPVLNEMMNTFREWFPFDETYDEEDKRDAENALARTKLNLELGEYTDEDYEYLFWLREKCKGNERYDKAIGKFIDALSYEYGWI